VRVPHATAVALAGLCVGCVTEPQPSRRSQTAADVSTCPSADIVNARAAIALVTVTGGSDYDRNVVIHTREQDTCVSDDDTTEVQDPSWSPDGLRLAYTSFDQLVIVDHDGKGKRRHKVRGYKPLRPRWSPQGDKLLYESICDAGGFDVLVLDLATESTTNLTFSKEEDGDAEWSPDGSRIAFSSDRSGSHEIYSMDAKGGSLVQLTHARGADESPVWSPDGNSIAFVSARNGNRGSPFLSSAAVGRPPAYRCDLVGFGGRQVGQQLGSLARPGLRAF